jgi:hypothetical protein
VSGISRKQIGAVEQDLRTAKQIELAGLREAVWTAQAKREHLQAQTALIRQDRFERTVLLAITVVSALVTLVGAASGHPIVLGGGGGVGAASVVALALRRLSPRAGSEDRYP